MKVKIDHGTGDFWSFFKLFEDFAIVTPVDLLGQILFHAQPAVVFLQT